MAHLSPSIDRDRRPWIATKLSQDGLQVSVHPGCAQGQGKVKGHVIRALSWILGMSYSVIDGLVCELLPNLCLTFVACSFGDGDG